MKNNRFRLMAPAGTALVAVSLVILFLIFGPLLKSELNYDFSGKGKNVEVAGNLNNGIIESGKSVIVPVDKEFGIVIPKISANAKVIANVDPSDSKIYQKALTEGVAQASGSALPNEEGNVFIFSHSGQDILQANRYNAVFYLLGKLEPGDDVYIFYQGAEILYQVKEIKIVAASEVRYMDRENSHSSLTLMTCWPAGTTWKRLIVIAEKK
jgi:LPXTG-site transpeptidase (sortase) family protein